MPRHIATLRRNTTFGEISLMTDELRSATVTVTSETATILQLSRSVFDEVLQSSKKIQESVQERMTQNVFNNSCSLFTAMPELSRKLLMEKMFPVSCPAGTYICRQGKQGSRLFIIISGACEVILKDPSEFEQSVAVIENGSAARSVGGVLVIRLYPGGMFCNDLFMS